MVPVAPFTGNRKMKTAKGKTSVLEGVYKLSLEDGINWETVIHELLKFDNVMYAEPAQKYEPLYIPSDPYAEPDRA